MECSNAECKHKEYKVEEITEENKIKLKLL